MELPEIREHLDRLDNSLITILAERMSFIPKVAEHKKQNKIERYQPEREKEIFEAKEEMAKKLELNPELVKTIFEAIIKDAHRIEKEIMGESSN
jgi:chorismate mutase